MAEQMTEEQLFYQERLNTGTSWTRNEFFEKNGYLVIKNLWNSQELYRPVPEESNCPSKFKSFNALLTVESE